MPKIKTMVTWTDEPAAQNYPSAASYLTLLYKKSEVQRLVGKLEKGAMASFKAKDIFRASGLPMLPLNNSHVKKDERKIVRGSALSPLLLVRDSAHGKLIIADGYHRLCAVYAFNEDAVIPCKIV